MKTLLTAIACLICLSLMGTVFGLLNAMFTGSLLGILCYGTSSVMIWMALNGAIDTAAKV